MKIKSIANNKLLRSADKFLVLALVFGISYGQEPLYSANQTTKFLHGLAKAGLVFLNEDWLANTIDPLPAFSFLVMITFTFFGKNMFYFYYIIFFGVYLYSTLGIASTIYPVKDNKLKFLVYIALVIAVHCIRVNLFGFDISYNLHSGVAVQYVLGPYFQPSNFGVLLIFSIYAFLQKKYFLAVLSSAVAATFHPAYILSAGVLNLSYMMITYKNEGSLKKILLIGGLAFFSILPVFSYMYLAFRPTSPELMQKSQELIVNFRIPHHSLPAVWLSHYSTYVQISLMVLALYLIRKTQVFLVMLIPFLTATILTIAQLFSGSVTLAFIAPWRISAFLVPISICIIIAWIISYLFNQYPQCISAHRQTLTKLSLVLISAFFIWGVFNQVQMLSHKDRSIPMMNFVEKIKQPGEIYLLPVKSPKLLQFRLYTGAPIFINLKSHPYKDVEVIEWYNRVQSSQAFYQAGKTQKCDLLRKMSADHKITHVILEEENFATSCDFLETLYQDKRYRVDRIRQS